jgi:hypothetical protein
MKHTSLRAIILAATLASLDLTAHAQQLADFYKMPLDESSLPPQRK